MEKTSHHIFGFWFHITWENDSIGYDQNGTKWNNKSNPQCSNSAIKPVCEILYDNINQLFKKN